MYYCDVANICNYLSYPISYGMNNVNIPINGFSINRPVYLPFINFGSGEYDINDLSSNNFFINRLTQGNFYSNNFLNQSVFNPINNYSSDNNNLFDFCLNPSKKRNDYLFINKDFSLRANTKMAGSYGKTFDNTDNAKSTSTWENFKKSYGVKTKTINGSKVYVCSWSSFSKSQPEWLGLQKHMIEAAEELGLTLVYSDMDRSVSASNASRKKKGNIVAPGGKSPHNYGTACDICLFKDGKQVSTKSAQFREFANLVKQKSNNQIAWGGDWSKKNEEHHFELRNWKKYQTEQYKIV